MRVDVDLEIPTGALDEVANQKEAVNGIKALLKTRKVTAFPILSSEMR
jgi:hypothetical protein